MRRTMRNAMTKYQMVKLVFFRVGFFFPPRSGGSLNPNNCLRPEGFLCSCFILWTSKDPSEDIVHVSEVAPEVEDAIEFLSRKKTLNPLIPGEKGFEIPTLFPNPHRI